MNELEKARLEIEKIDRDIALLFESRMNEVRKIAQYKEKTGMPVFDAGREAALIEKNSEMVRNGDLRSYYVSFLQNIMAISKNYQSDLMNGMKIAYCGVEGAFANIASKKIFPNSRPIPYSGFDSAYSSVVNGECECCVLPIENSTAGEVGPVIDMMFSGSLYVNGVYSLPVKHNLLGLKTAHNADIKKVISHPQALMQCSEYIKEHKFETEESTNTAVAAQTVASLNDGSVAAIASKETAELFGLRILDHDINEKDVNTTRFAVFSRSKNENIAQNNKFILIFTIANEVGALAKAVNIISAHGFDMRVLRSRPVKDVPWQYYFYVEANGDQYSDEGQRMLRALSVCCDKLKIAGHYSDEIDLSKI